MVKEPTMYKATLKINDLKKYYQYFNSFYKINDKRNKKIIEDSFRRNSGYPPETKIKILDVKKSRAII